MVNRFLRLRRDADFGRQLIDQRLAVGQVRQFKLEIGLGDQLVEVRPAEQRALQHVDLDQCCWYPTARPRSNGVSTASASTYMRALLSYWFGIANTAAQPIGAHQPREQDRLPPVVPGCGELPLDEEPQDRSWACVLRSGRIAR